MRISDLIIEQDRQFIALNKPPGMPCHPDPTQDISLFKLAESYCKQTLYPLNRIDRPTSGLVIFAKTQKAASHFNRQFQEKKTDKIYLCVVADLPEERSGKLTHMLKKAQKTNKMHVVDSGGKAAEMLYQHVCSIERYHLLMVRLITGRHHQIRAQMSAVGSPIKGDVKYGFRRSNKDRSIHLHAFKLGFQHPTKGLFMHLTVMPPEEVVWKTLLSETTNEELVLLSQEMMNHG